MNKKETLQRYAMLRSLYHKLEKEGAGHIFSPCHPTKDLYRKTLKEILSILKEWKEIDELTTEIEEFEKVFSGAAGIR